jgi:hypothetical protein
MDVSSSRALHYSGEFLHYAAAYLGLLLHHDVDLYPLTGSGLLFWMRQSHQ